MQKNLTQQVKECAVLFYQNKEKEAYSQLNSMLQEINQRFQRFIATTSNATGEEEKELNQYMMELVNEFVNAYQVKDNLALADLLYYNIAEVIAV